MNSICERWVIILMTLCFAYAPGHAQVIVSGRVRMPRLPDSEDLYPLTTILSFGTPAEPLHQSCSSRSWETEPAGWYHLSGNEGRYTIAYAAPGQFMRPVILTNQYLASGEEIVRNITPRYDYAVMWERAWDGHPAHAYYQTFRARSKSVTHIGFKLAYDGVDGEGPLKQNLIASLHRKAEGTPDTWPRIGREMPVLGVNAGGVLDIQYAAGWNSGEIPITPGEVYAVCLRTEKPDGAFQCYWSPDVEPEGDCYRVADRGETGWTGQDMWMYIAGDGDDLLVPFNKCVQHQFHELTKFGRKWTQTYRASGRGPASVMLYTAIAVEQGSLLRQRFIVRVRRDGPDGEIIGSEKLAIGQTTATAQSGVLGVCFEPGEVVLEPGRIYAIEFESFADHKGFNPWMKNPADPYDEGKAYFNDTDEVGYDLDMIVVEYEHAGQEWPMAVEAANLLPNGDMEQGTIDDEDDGAGTPESWQPFATDPETVHWYRTRMETRHGRMISIAGGSVTGQPADGGYVQVVTGLARARTYRLRGSLRSSWPVDHRHQAWVGYDPTGQTEDPTADSIRWKTMPNAYSIWETYQSDPLRPEKDAISVWLRAKTTLKSNETFVVDFDDFSLRAVKEGVPAIDDTVESK